MPHKIDRPCVFAEFIAPEIEITSQTVLEGGGPRNLSCSNPNSAEISIGLEWFRVSDGVSLGTSGTLFFNAPINRTLTGEYECQLTSLLHGTITSGVAELIVESKLLHVTAILLSCFI